MLADGTGGSGEFFHASRGENHIGPGLRERTSEAGTQPGTSAGDHGDPAVESEEIDHRPCLTVWLAQSTWHKFSSWDHDVT
ncbi:hypothetical protein MANY_26390 [Mycolicibacterium anyangense]|uniref:Uncharacterized protein n=1 Tax=Mycolicibacterium anyangense TaxID=1431246 RepID=A0A6N4WB67_9MYCO|nr:hypothetical protein MANY_26390 [Mycolicibacterium anyangense]